MRRAPSVALIPAAGTATLYAFWVTGGLVRGFAAGVTWIDTGTLFVMGLIAGVAIGQFVRFRERG